MSIRSRTSERVQTVRTGVAERIEALAGTIDKKALYAGIAATFLIGLLSLVVPIIPFFGFITGGVVGGFIAAYAAGGLVRGIVHGVVAAVIGGIILAGLGVGQGLLLGFVFIETPTIIGAFTPAISAVFSGSRCSRSSPRSWCSRCSSVSMGPSAVWSAARSAGFATDSPDTVGRKYVKTGSWRSIAWAMFRIMDLNQFRPTV